MAPAQKKAKVADCAKGLENNKVEDSDDDFEVCPPKQIVVYANKQCGPGESSKPIFISNKEKGNSRKSDDQSFPRLIYRTCPNILVSAIEKMNENQRNEVIRMGFGSLLSLKVKFIPTQLGYGILDNFDTRSCEIILKKDKTLRITSDDVYRVFGLPRGVKQIERKENYEQVESYRRWVSHFKSNKYGVKARDILDAMTADRGEGGSGELFRRNFMVLLNNCLIESNSTGYIKPQIMDCFEDVTSLDRWDWCSYIISRLVYHKSNWDKNKSNAFCGPILFLTALYVDRVEFNGKKVSRGYPTIKYLTFDDMKRRQNDEIKEGCFGHGYPTEPLDIPNEILPLPSITLKDGSTSGSNDELHQFAKNFIIKVKNVAKTMTELMDMVEDAPENIIKSNSYLKMLDAAQNLLAFKPLASSSSKDRQQTQICHEDNEDEFWILAERAAAIAQIDQAIVRRNDFVKCCDDMPSFSIGLTQEFGEAPGDRLNSVHDRNIGDYGKDVQDQHFEDENIGSVSHGNEKQIRSKVLNDVTNVHNIEHMVQQDGGIDVSLKKIRRGKEKVAGDGVDNIQTDVGSCTKEAPKVKQCVEKITHNMITRDKKVLKKSIPLKSPFQSRILDSSDKIFKEDRVICFWVMHKDDANEDEILYKNSDTKLTRFELMTLGPNQFISRGIIDVWSIIASKKEEYRSAVSPLRFFATTKVCLSTIVDAPGEIDLEERMSVFNEKLRLEVGMVPGLDVKKIDVFVFPVMEAENCYLMCMDVKNITLDILDHTQNEGSNKDVERYEDKPVLLRSFMAFYLKRNRLAAKAKKVETSVIHVEDITWADQKNKLDCGVFAMRHMETYLGFSNYASGVGFSKGRKMQTRYMRIKYCAAILASETNEMASANDEKAKAFYAENSIQGTTSIDKFLLGK